MFKSAVFKLTSWYVGALVLVCFIFSVPIYAITSARLRNNAVQQTNYVRQLPRTFNSQRIIPQLEDLREQQLRRDRRQLLTYLLIMNGSIIGLGAYASYIFARRTLKPIEQAHAAQAQFTANASHELRTPLAVMQTEIDVAMRNRKLTAKEAREILQSNLEEVARLRQLSDQLLGLTRAEAEPLKLTKVNLAKLLQDHMKLLTKRHGVAITVEVNNSAKGLTIMADKTLLAQVFDIIVDNAVIYSGLDDPNLKVTLNSNKQRAMIEISNQGKIIPKIDLDRIFDRFYRGTDANAQNPKGHGLGLALAQDIIARHDGEILVKSKASETAFLIKLPISQ